MYLTLLALLLIQLNSTVPTPSSQCQHLTRTLRNINHFIRFQRHLDQSTDRPLKLNISIIQQRKCKLKLDINERSFFFSYYYFRDALKHLDLIDQRNCSLTNLKNVYLNESSLFQVLKSSGLKETCQELARSNKNYLIKTIHTDLNARTKIILRKRPFQFYVYFFVILILVTGLVLLHQFVRWQKNSKNRLYECFQPVSSMKEIKKRCYNIQRCSIQSLCVSENIQVTGRFPTNGIVEDPSKWKFFNTSQQIFIDVLNSEDGDARSEFSSTDPSRMDLVQSWLDSITNLKFIKIRVIAHDFLATSSNAGLPGVDI